MKKSLILCALVLGAALADSLSTGLMLAAQSKDQVGANKYFKIACEQEGSAEGCYMLAESYYIGRGASANPAKAIEYYVKACNLGETAGCYDAGEIYSKGEGEIKADSKKAKEFYDKSCKLGTKEACEKLKTF